jgi:hypothetical protein
MAEHLTYFIADQLLVGDVNGIHFQEHAVSGGRAGRKNPKTRDTLPPADPGLANNVWRTDKKGKVGTEVLGGPIPCGEYAVVPKPNQDGRDLRLNLAPTSHIWIISSGARDNDFQIHGRGPHGSYGCIVVLDYGRLTLLYHAVRSSGEVNLNVIAGTIDDIV